MICLVSHDAGGAELLSSWAINKKGVFYIILKVSSKILKENLKILKFKQKIIKKKTNIFITGTSKNPS